MLVVLDNDVDIKLHYWTDQLEVLHNYRHGKRYVNIQYNGAGEIEKYEDCDGNYYDREKMSIELPLHEFMYNKVMNVASYKDCTYGFIRGDVLFSFDENTNLYKTLGEGIAYHLYQRHMWTNELHQLMQSIVFLSDGKFYKTRMTTREYSSNQKEILTFITKKITFLCS